MAVVETRNWPEWARKEAGLMEPTRVDGAEQTEPAERVGDWSQTYTGRKVYPLDPREDEIDIIDIAHSLAMQCRFNGHTRVFFSVAEHCCLAHDLAPQSLKLAALLHDASEAYLCDLPRPIKCHETFALGYTEAELALMRLIACRFGFEFPLPAEVQTIDRRLAMTEALQLMAPLHEWKDRPGPFQGLHLGCWHPVFARAQFLERYRSLAANGVTPEARGSL